MCDEPTVAQQLFRVSDRPIRHHRRFSLVFIICCLVAFHRDVLHDVQVYPIVDHRPAQPPFYL